jgi:molybdenum cofactor cytidylyltransferase
MIWALITAAGESRRMGRPKMLLPFGTGTVIETVLSQAAASRAAGTLVVLGADRRKIEPLAAPFASRIVFNRDYRSGMLSSIQTGFRALPGDVGAACVLLGDQPWISSALIDTMLDAFEKSEKTIAVPVHGGRRGHPVVIDRCFEGEILTLDHAVGLRQLLRRFSKDVLEVPVCGPEVLRDLDTPGDYRRARSDFDPSDP